VLGVSKEAGLEVNAERLTNYMVIYRRQNSGQNYNLMIAMKCLEKVALLEYFITKMGLY
jgi:hypothetical protein